MNDKNSNSDVVIKNVAAQFEQEATEALIEACLDLYKAVTGHEVSSEFRYQTISESDSNLTVGKYIQVGKTSNTKTAVVIWKHNHLQQPVGIQAEFKNGKYELRFGSFGTGRRPTVEEYQEAVEAIKAIGYARLVGNWTEKGPSSIANLKKLHTSFTA